MCECDAEGCEATARVRLHWEIPEGWVRRQIVDTVPAQALGESDFSGNVQHLYCPEHVAKLDPPLSPDVARQLAQRARLAAAPAVAVTDEASKSSAD